MSAFDAFLSGERRIGRFAALLRSCLSADISLDTQRQVEVVGKRTPVLKNGSAVLNLDCTIPDRFTAQTGVTATIFARSGEDFVRISTSIKKQSGERALGTALNHAHPGYSRLIGGQPYVGYATLFGAQYLTQYDPIRDSRGQVIGALYVGIDASQQFRLSMAAKLALLAGVLGGALFSTVIWQFAGTIASGTATALAGQQTSAIVDARNSYLVIGLVAVLILASVIYQVVSRTVARPLHAARDAAKRLAAGDLTAQLHVDRADEIGELMQAVNGVSQGLSEIVGNVRDGSNQITVASGEIATGNAELSSRTSSQAAALEETASATKELTTAVRHNSDNAQQANQLVLTAATRAADGGEVISQVVQTMTEIKRGSTQVGQFVNEIEEIAFQTNILALNAAVEAARAGEQGRSFTVVAGDVRSLAHRCDVAAKQIKSLTSNSAERVDAGGALAEQARRTMGEIVVSVKRVVEIMNEIGDASRQQGEGIEQVGAAIDQMDQMTQQNAALVEQAAAATESLHSQAERLATAVAAFKLR
jgi:methyl-accepting chemotaxis protein-2 (aspartate sensor receptor)